MTIVSRVSGSGDSGVEVILAIGFLLDALNCSAALLGRSSVALVDATADSLLLLGGADSRLDLSRRGVRGDGTAGGGFGTIAVVNLGFEGGGFFLDDSEAAFDGVIGGSWGIVSRRKKWVKVSRGGWRDTKGAKVVGTYRCHTWRRSCGSRAVDMMSVLFL